MRNIAVLAVVMSVLSLASGNALANIGLPLVAVFLPLMWSFLILIVLIEAFVLARKREMTLGRATIATAIANVCSTLLGVPVLWMLLAALQLWCCGDAQDLSTLPGKLYAVTIQAPWLLPYEGEFGWMVPVAIGTVFILCAAMSVLAEAPIIAWVTRREVRSMWGTVAQANLLSYLALGGVTLLMYTRVIPHFGLSEYFAPIFEPMIEWVFMAAQWLRGENP